MEESFKAEVRAKSKADAARELYGYDHAFIGAEGCAFFAEVFGCDPTQLPTYAGRTNIGPHNPKGLVMEPGAEGSAGMDAVSFTGWLTGQLGLGNPGGMFMGRGFALRANVDAIVKHFASADHHADNPTA